ncbi:DUF3137 domain-containing protein [[Muricauda] lutisoli]|uniref:DUF3137 domain-containing protein n=1 Tax=[Muricauda] lutisoli TaxID=2816035 RepID=A0ABS3ESB7_9FLAO|nr:DUF3137 domain-containing protein [[Muricauda] lutisoli]MBO0329134.1 DUF3137 domain-containing protein [[Muricauda] lutisoli]
MMDFQNLKKELLPLLQEAEKLRKTYRFYKLTYTFLIQLFLICGIALVLFVYLFNSKFTEWIASLSPNTPWTFTPQMLVLFFWFLFFISLTIFQTFKNKYVTIEKRLIRVLLDKMVPTFEFYEHEQIKTEELINSELVTMCRRPFDKKTHVPVYNRGQGLLSGKVKDTSITIGNVNIIDQRYGSYLMYIPFFAHIYIAYTYIRPMFKKEKSIEQIGSSLSGMFAIVDFNKKCNGTTIVLPDQFEKRIGYLAKTIQSLNFGRDQLVNLEDSEFEKEFVVYSTDQVEARYILSTSLMRRITLLKQKINKPVILSFKGGKLYMAVHHPYGFFSLQENKNLIDSNVLELFYDDITTAIGIVEDLNLNTQVWR